MTHTEPPHRLGFVAAGTGECVLCGRMADRRTTDRNGYACCDVCITGEDPPIGTPAPQYTRPVTPDDLLELTAANPTQTATITADYIRSITADSEEMIVCGTSNRDHTVTLTIVGVAALVQALIDEV